MKLSKIFSASLALALVFCAVAGLSACGSKSDEKTITVAATSIPHAEILEKCKEAMKAKGYTLEIKVVADYVTPNTLTQDGEVDANYFQHTPYLNQFNEEQKTTLVSVATVHYEPFGIYAGKTKSLDALADGATIAVPNDATNEARALLLLADNGLIELNDGAGLTATVKDIKSNPHNFQIREVEAALVPGLLSEVDVGIINGNYALESGLKVSEALAAEKSDSEAAKTYGNVLVVKAGNENLPKVKALVEVIMSQEIADFITEKYQGAVVSMK